MDDRALGPETLKTRPAVSRRKQKWHAHGVKALGNGEDLFPRDVDIENGDVDGRTAIEHIERLAHSHGERDDDAAQFVQHIFELHRHKTFVFDGEYPQTRELASIR
ncbi:hypothetical protein ACLNGM_13270 [Aureimonas phyllosphaerae]|uniref:hypothetical protein n=1 Tax=Aureimonas phyllosphaerae TaxID=1166078 RepID=UPI003A5C1FAD